MNYKQFISSVSAFAIAATTFTAMAVTASADTTHGPTRVISKTIADNATWNAGVVTAGPAKSYGAVRLDFSDLEGITDATTVTIEFDTRVYAGSGQTWYGVGDASARSNTVNGSGGYATAGLGMFFGSPDGTAYKVRDIKQNNYVNSVNGAIGVSAHAKITFDKDAGEYTYNIGPLSGTEKTDINNLTILDAYTNVSNGQFAFANVEVTYTVPSVPVSISGSEPISGSDGDAVIVGGTISGVDEIETLTITADGSTKVFTNGSQFNFDTVVSGSDVEIAVVVKGVSNVTAIAIN